MSDEQAPSASGVGTDEQRFREKIQEAGGDPSSEIDFNTFLISLGSSAFGHIMGGALPTGEVMVANLGMARQTIDILGMLEHKTRGNLTTQEAQLIQTLLYDLRLRYVQALTQQQNR